MFDLYRVFPTRFYSLFYCPSEKNLNTEEMSAKSALKQACLSFFLSLRVKSKTCSLQPNKTIFDFCLLVLIFPFLIFDYFRIFFTRVFKGKHGNHQPPTKKHQKWVLYIHKILRPPPTTPLQNIIPWHPINISWGKKNYRTECISIPNEPINIPKNSRYGIPLTQSHTNYGKNRHLPAASVFHLHQNIFGLLPFQQTSSFVVGDFFVGCFDLKRKRSLQISELDNLVDDSSCRRIKKLKTLKIQDNSVYQSSGQTKRGDKVENKKPRIEQPSYISLVTDRPNWYEKLELHGSPNDGNELGGGLNPKQVMGNGSNHMDSINGKRSSGPSGGNRQGENEDRESSSDHLTKKDTRNSFGSPSSGDDDDGYWSSSDTWEDGPSTMVTGDSDSDPIWEDAVSDVYPSSEINLVWKFRSRLQVVSKYKVYWLHFEIPNQDSRYYSNERVTDCVIGWLIKPPLRGIDYQRRFPFDPGIEWKFGENVIQVGGAKTLSNKDLTWHLTQDGILFTPKSNVYINFTGKIASVQCFYKCFSRTAMVFFLLTDLFAKHFLQNQSQIDTSKNCWIYRDTDHENILYLVCSCQQRLSIGLHFTFFLVCRTNNDILKNCSIFRDTDHEIIVYLVYSCLQRLSIWFHFVFKLPS